MINHLLYNVQIPHGLPSVRRICNRLEIGFGEFPLGVSGFPPLAISKEGYTIPINKVWQDRFLSWLWLYYGEKAMSERKDTLQQYVSDMLAAERHILPAIENQLKTVLYW